MARGRTRIVGDNQKAMFRLLNRTFDNVTPKVISTVSQLPPARKNKGRIIYVGGVVNATYVSNGVSWSLL
jgi:hypothetical protein